MKFISTKNIPEVAEIFLGCGPAPKALNDDEEGRCKVLGSVDDLYAGIEDGIPSFRSVRRGQVLLFDGLWCFTLVVSW